MSKKQEEKDEAAAEKAHKAEVKAEAKAHKAHPAKADTSKAAEGVTQTTDVGVAPPDPSHAIATVAPEGLPVAEVPEGHPPVITPQPIAVAEERKAGAKEEAVVAKKPETDYVEDRIFSAHDGKSVEETVVSERGILKTEPRIVSEGGVLKVEPRVVSKQNEMRKGKPGPKPGT